MGELISNATTLSGDEIKVVFSKNGDLPQELAMRLTSITLQMDGDEGYSPSRMTTASIGCLTDGVALLRSINNSDVSVAITNVTRDRMLFKGFVVPNSLSQSVSGINDVVTIECVDSIGYANYVRYRRVEDDNELLPAGFQAMTLRAAVERIASMIGSPNIALPRSIVIKNPDTGESTDKFEELVISEEYMYSQNTPSPNITDFSGWLSYMPYAMTCREALDMIAESFRMTWVQQGDTLYLYDNICVTRYDNLATGFAEAPRDAVEIAEDDYDGTSCNVSTCASYSLVRVHHEQDDRISLIPDIYDQNYLVAGVNELQYSDGNQEDSRVVSTMLDSLTCATKFNPLTSPSVYSHFVAWLEQSGKRLPDGTVLYDNNVAWGDGSTWNVGVKLVDVAQESNGPNGSEQLLAIKKHFLLSSQATAGLCIYFDFDFVASAKSSPEVGWLWPKNEENIECFLIAMLKVGGQYYNIRTNEFQDDASSFYIHIYSDGGYLLRSSNAFREYDRVSIPLTRDGEVEVIIRSRNALNLGWKVGYIRKLDVYLKENVAQQVVRPNTEEYGTYMPGKDIDVTPPIDLYYKLAPKRFGTVINSVDYRATNGSIELGYKQESTASSPISLAKRIWLQHNFGDRLRWEIPLRDEANAITPLDAFTCAPLWNGRKIVAGYTKDIINNQTILTLV